MPAPTWVSGGSVRSSTASFPCPLPSGTNGDVLYLVCFMTRGGTGSQTWNTPAGWTAKGTASSAGQGIMTVFERVTDGTEGTSVTVTATTAPVIGSVACLRVTGNNLLTPTDDIDIATPNIGTSIIAPAGTTTGPDRLIIRVFAEADTGAVRTWTTATGYTEQQDANSIAIDTLAQPTAGTTGTATATVSTTGAVGAVTICVAPSTGAFYTKTYAVTATPSLFKSSTGVVTRKVTATVLLGRVRAAALSRSVVVNTIVSRLVPGQLFQKTWTAVVTPIVTAIRSLLPSAPVPGLMTLTDAAVTRSRMSDLAVTTMTLADTPVE